MGVNIGFPMVKNTLNGENGQTGVPEKEEKNIEMAEKSHKLGCLWQRLLSSPLERGAGGVAANLHTPLSLFVSGESQKIEIPEH